MLQADFIKENFSKVVNSLKKRNKDYSKDLKKIIDYNDSRKKQQKKGLINSKKCVSKL